MTFIAHLLSGRIDDAHQLAERAIHLSRVQHENGSRAWALRIAGIIAADREALKSIFSEPDKFYAAAPYTLLFASLIVLIFGPGTISLDYLIARYVRKRHSAEPEPVIISQKV